MLNSMWSLKTLTIVFKHVERLQIILPFWNKLTDSWLRLVLQLLAGCRPLVVLQGDAGNLYWF